ncbi:hypothetical protein [Streptomyces sp. R08]|uniref:Uncharacterized protein n=1 Tax=Streptomyces sp. R08 TaxID=3238624 RepID=A0AB39M1Y8_9ACTN
MGQHTTNEVYDKLTDVEQKLDNNAKSTVTTAHFDTKVSELKKAIQDGGKKKEEDEKQKWEDLVKDMSPIKEFLAVAKGDDLFSRLILMVTAGTAAVALVAGLAAKVKSLTLAITGRTRTLGVVGSVRPQAQQERRYYGQNAQGRWGMRPEDDAQPQQPNLPSVAQIDAVKQAMAGLNTEVDTYRGKVRGLATPGAMRKMASAAKKLESAARQHQSVDTLATSVRNLNTELRALAGTAS